MKSKNERISLWILEQERENNQEKAQKIRASINEVEGKNHCLKCKRNYNEPKLVQYYACPHCLNKLEEEEDKGCRYWFGYLSQKDKSESLPQECVDCKKVMNCMLNQFYSSSVASKIDKWY